MKKKEMDESFLQYVSIDDNLKASGKKFDSEIATNIMICKVVLYQKVGKWVSDDEITISLVPFSTKVSLSCFREYFKTNWR